MVIGALGIGQIFAWGSSYDLPAVLAKPIVDSTGWSLTWIVGGLSLGRADAGLQFWPSSDNTRSVASFADRGCEGARRHGHRAGSRMRVGGILVGSLAPVIETSTGGWWRGLDSNQRSHYSNGFTVRPL